MGGYIFARLVELGGPPRSARRIAQCDNELNGIPSSVSPIGAAACYHSPHVGAVYQAYAWAPGPPPEDFPMLGCEVAVYAWGWPEPAGPTSLGQDWEGWFRNGELRLTAWYRLNDRSTVVPPAEPSWWDAGCFEAWSQIQNWLYAGKYQIGETIYTDTLANVPQVSLELSGASTLTSSLDATIYQFPETAFSQPVSVVHTVLMEDSAQNAQPLFSTNHVFEVAAFNPGSGASVQPNGPFTITVSYEDAGLSEPLVADLALYYWDGSAWLREPTSVHIPGSKMVQATTDHLGRWALFLEPFKTMIPSLTQK